MKTRVARLLAAIVFAGLLAATPALGQTTYYVDDDAPGDPGPGDPLVGDPLEDGTAAHPFDAIQEGIEASADGDTVLVLDGTYTGEGNRDIDFGGRAIEVRSENGPEQCVIDCQGNYNNPHRGFHFHSGEGLDSIVRGFTIRKAVSFYHGTIRCVNSSPTIDGNAIVDNDNYRPKAGGIACINADPDILNNTISGNLGEFGGGIWCDRSSPRISGNRILDNIAYLGGGIACRSSSPEISGNLIVGNRAWDEDSLGGGIYCECGGSPLITNNEISGNKTGEDYTSGEGGGIYCGSGTSPSISGNRITGNLVLCAYPYTRYSSDGYGGGICCAQNSTPTIANNYIAGNILHCHFVSDSNWSCYGGGGGIACRSGSSPTIVNNTIIGNFFQDDVVVSGGGIYCESSSAMIVNCIVRGNLPDQVDGCDGQVTFCDVEGGHDGEGNFDADPFFVAGPEGCYYLGQLATGQVWDSPCVDAGSAPASEICFSGPDGPVCFDQLTTRIDGAGDTGAADIGCHHGDGLATPCPPTISAEYACNPKSGTVPFSVTSLVSLVNLHAGQTRRFAARISLTIGSGRCFPNWRSGVVELAPEETFSTSWVLTLPAIGTVIGDNRALLTVEDVTAAPYNQPPYPPAGDTDTAGCTVTAAAS